MAVSIQKVSNADLIIDGTSQVGKVSEIKLPEVKYTIGEHKALGMIGAISYQSGVDKLGDGEITWAGWYQEIMTEMGKFGKPVRLQVRANHQTFSNNGAPVQVPLVIYMNVISEGIPGGTFKPGENAEFSTKFSCNSMKIEIDGVPVFEFDPAGNILLRNGVDELSGFKANLGI